MGWVLGHMSKFSPFFFFFVVVGIGLGTPFKFAHIWTLQFSIQQKLNGNKRDFIGSKYNYHLRNTDKLSKIVRITKCLFSTLGS